MTSKTLLAILAFAVLPTTAAVAGYPYPGADHDTLGECYDYAVNQYNDNGDEEGLEFSLNDCDDAYAEMVGVPEPIDQLGVKDGTSRGGGFILLPPASLSDNSDMSTALPRRR